MEEKKISPSPSPPTHHEDAPQMAPHHERVYRATNVDGQPAYSEHGALIDHQIPQEQVVQSQPDLRWSRIRHMLRDPFSEFFGVFILILFGDGVVAQVVLSDGEKGEYQSISWGWGIGVMLGVYASGISGGYVTSTTLLRFLFHSLTPPQPHQPGRDLRQLRLSQVPVAQVPRLHACPDLGRHVRLGRGLWQLQVRH